MSDNCIFCKIAAGEIPADKVYEDDLVVGFRDLNPQAPTHILLILRKHIPTINDITEQDEQLIGRMYRIAAQLAEQEGFSQSGYRCVINCNEAGGQTVFHLHMHLLGGRGMHWPPG